MKRAWSLLLLVAIGCSGSRAGRGDAEEPEGARRPSFGSETAGENIGALTDQLVRQGLENQGCFNVEILASAELQHPGGKALVMRAELCSGYEEEPPLAYLATAVGTEFAMSNTLQPLLGIGRGHTDQVRVISFEAPRVERNGPNIVVLRYRTPAEGEGDWLEQLIVGTFSADALDLAVVQPLSYDLRVGGGRMTGDGSFELADTNGDGRLDLRMTLHATGQGCGGGRNCRNGEHRCELTVPWRATGYEVELSGDDCVFLGRLEL
jgi:hypothetical protein